MLSGLYVMNQLHNHSLSPRIKGEAEKISHAVGGVALMREVQLQPDCGTAAAAAAGLPSCRLGDTKGVGIGEADEGGDVGGAVTLV